MSWVSIGIAAVGTVSSIMGGISGKDAAEKAGEDQAKIIEKTAAENQRRRQLDLDKQLGGITAMIGASNIQMSGSAKNYRNDFESTYRSEMAWDKQKARLDAEYAKNTGQAAGSAAMYQGLGSAVGFAGSAAGGLMARGQANASPTSSSPFYFGKKSGVG